jgi:polysaccharide export outer membrane protein
VAPRTPAPVATSGTTPPTPASPTTSATSTAGDYRLSVGDKLRIEVYKDQQLSQSVQIRPDGKITLPLLGDVVAAGLTPTALRDQLTTSLREYITNPVVTVIVQEATPATVFVMGEVKTPGPQPIRGQMTVLEALSMAGGFLDFAKTSDIRVLRKSPAGTETLKFNYKKAVKGEGETIVLKPGDIVVVP